MFSCRPRATALALLAALAAAPAAARAEEARLNLYNWADYIGTDTIARFEAETGIKVTYDTYDSDAAMEAKVMAGESGYDLLTTSANFFGRQIKAGVYARIDKARLPNWKNLDPAMLAMLAPHDPGNAHAVPYLFGVNGFAYNVKLVRALMPDAPVDSLDMIFKPDIARRFAGCGITFMDSAEDVLQLALNYLGKDPNTTSAEDYAAAETMLLRVRPYVRAFDSAAYINALPNREICIAMSWSGDYQTALRRGAAAGIALDLAFTIPREGANIWFDAWLMPEGAPHPQNAYKFLNYIMKPEVIAAVTNTIHYGNANLAARRYVEPELLTNPAIYPDIAHGPHLYPSAEVGARLERLRTRVWNRIKTGH